MTFRALMLVFLTAVLFPNVVNGFQESVTLNRKDGQVDVLLDGDLFTRLDYKTYAKPILFPVFAPDQIAMTRDWPMKLGTKGEGHDHPHHKSIWVGHKINGVDFWTEKGGKVKTGGVITKFADATRNAILTKSEWLKRSNDQTILTDETVYWFGGDADSRWINCLIDFQASHGTIVFEDTKEGLFAIRTHPDLRLTPDAKAGVEQVFGHAINSEGDAGKDVWGKPAKWILYFGSVNGKPVSLAMYDHPSNLRHPTTWMARDYGLIAANPFGLHYFLGRQKGAGEFEIEQGGNLQLRYRVEFFKGVVTAELVEKKFQAFADEPLNKPVPKTGGPPSQSDTAK